MKITKQQLKKIIKEELSGVLKEMNPEIPGEELPQGGELDQALDADAPLSREEQIAMVQRKIKDIEDSFQGIASGGPEQGMRKAAADELGQLYQTLKMLRDVK
jgi:hypothetical protein